MLLTTSLKQHDTLHITFDSLIINSLTVIPNEASSVDAIKAEQKRKKKPTQKHINTTSYRIESSSKECVQLFKAQNSSGLGKAAQWNS